MRSSPRFPIVAVALAAAAAFAPAALRAQDAAVAEAAASRSTRPIRFGFGGGVLVPREGATMATLKQGAHGQGFIVFQLPAGLPAIRANVDFARMRLERQATGAPIPGNGAPTQEDAVRTMLAGVASLKFDLLRGPVRPYVLAGVGGFRFKDDVQNVAGDARSQLDFGVEGGAGLSIRLGPIDAFAETRLQNVYTKQKGLFDARSVRAFPVTFGFSI